MPRKRHHGKWYSVSCRQLSPAGMKEASAKAANEWWYGLQGLPISRHKDTRLAKAVTALAAWLCNSVNFSHDMRKKLLRRYWEWGSMNG